MKMNKRLMLLLLTLLLLPALICLFLAVMANIESEKLQTSEAKIQQSATALDDKIALGKTLLNMFTSDLSIREYYSIPANEARFNDQVDELEDLRKRILLIENYDSVYCFRVFVPESKYYKTENINFFGLSSWDTKTDGPVPGAEALISIPYEKHYIFNKSSKVITLSQRITHSYFAATTVGVACLDIDYSYLYDIFSDNLNDMDFCIVRKNDLAVICPSESEDMSFLQNIIETLGNDRRTLYTRNGELFMACALESADWVTIVHLGSGRFIFRTTDHRYSTIAIMLLIALVMFIAGAILISRRLTMRISSLVTTTYTSNDSIPRGLYKSLDTAIGEVKDLIIQREQSIRKQEEARLKLLQAQINPHFLYNSMDTLRWMIANGEKEKAEDMVMAMSKYFRLILSQGKDIITLREEVELTKLYIGLQESRMDNSFNVEFDLPEETMECLIPKMSLQPLVENAILHGLECINKGCIYVDADLTDKGELEITVTDDGKGFDIDKVNKVLSGEETNKGFGLFNVQQRIRLFSESEDYGITAETEEGKYASFTILVKQPSIHKTESTPAG